MTAAIMSLVHLQKCKHKPVVLVGGATGMVGDPSGKSKERNLLDEKTLTANLTSIKKQLEKFLDFNCGKNSAELVNNNVDVIVIDTAHGHSKSVMDMTKSIKNKFSNLDLIVGNVATPHAVESLIDCGADAVKIQTYTTDTITINCNKEDFQIRDGLWKGQTLYELYKDAHMPWDWHKPLFEHANSISMLK